MNFKRWYDKYPELQSLLSLLESIDEQNLSYISQDFLQIILSKYGSKFDEVIESLKQNAPPAYGRWYDDDYNLHTCIEFIKMLDDKEKKEIVNSFILSLMSYIPNNGR